MKKLVATLAIVLGTTGLTQQSWALLGLGDSSFDGSLEVSGNSADNEVSFSPANDHRGNTATRVRLGMNTSVTEGVKGRLELVRTPRLYGTGVTTVAGEEALWSFQNAYVEFEDLWGMTARLGRQYVGDPGDLVWNISPINDDSLTTSALDGLMVKCKETDQMDTMWDKINLMFFTGKAVEDDGIANTDADDAAGAGDVNLSNIQANLHLIPGGKIMLAYLLGDDSNATAASDNNHLRIFRLGVNGGLKDNMFTYRAELLQNTGEFNGAGLSGLTADKLKYEGRAIDLGAGFNSSETSAGKFGVHLNILAASGDDNVTNNKDESFHDFSVVGTPSSDRLLGEIFGKSNTLGGGTPFGRGINTSAAQGGAVVSAAAPNTATQGQGLQVFNIGGMIKPAFAPKTWAGIDFFTFTRAEDSVKTAAATTTNVGDKIGNEFDLTLGYIHSDNVNFELGYANLKPKEALTGIGAVNDENIEKWFARTMIKWGGESSN